LFNKLKRTSFVKSEEYYYRQMRLLPTPKTFDFVIVSSGYTERLLEKLLEKPVNRRSAEEAWRAGWEVGNWQLVAVVEGNGQKRFIVGSDTSKIEKLVAKAIKVFKCPRAGLLVLAKRKAHVPITLSNVLAIPRVIKTADYCVVFDLLSIKFATSSVYGSVAYLGLETFRK
jgi:hypothetical protein